MSKTATPKNMVKALASNDSTLENEAGDFYVDIDSLQAHGVNMADLKKLKSVGICTIRVLKIMGSNQPMRAWKQKGNTL